jgi:hypothetical protein
MSICGKTTTLTFLDIELVHHFINRKLVIRVHLPSQSSTSPLCTCHWSLPLKYYFHFRFRLSCDRRSVCLGVGTPSGACDQIFITVEHLRSSCWSSSLTRGRVCNLLVRFAITLPFNSRRTHDHILLSHLRPYITVSYESPPAGQVRSGLHYD